MDKIFQVFGNYIYFPIEIHRGRQHDTVVKSTDPTAWFHSCLLCQVYDTLGDIYLIFLWLGFITYEIEMIIVHIHWDVMHSKQVKIRIPLRTVSGTN